MWWKDERTVRADVRHGFCFRIFVQTSTEVLCHIITSNVLGVTVDGDEAGSYPTETSNEAHRYILSGTMTGQDEESVDRGQLLRKLRALERQDEAERAATADGELSLQQPVVVVQTQAGATIVLYASFLAHQRYYDDLKHVDHKYIDFGDFQTGSRLVLEQDKSLGKGGFCWDAAFVLGEYLVQQLIETPATKQEIRAIELGCGTGLAGLIVAKAVPDCHVVLTDLPELMPLLNRNVHRNFHKDIPIFEEEVELREYMHRDVVSNNEHVRGSVSASILTWGDRGQEESHGTFDIVFAADVVATLYDPVALAKTIANLCHDKTTVYVSFKERLSSIHRHFEESMGARFGRIDIIRPTESRNRNPEIRIMIARAKRKL